jgi:hypothetical protein
MDPEQLAANRTQLAHLARQKSKRRVPRELPCEWVPRTIPNPADGNQPFTEAGAWELIADLLETPEQEVQTITLERPPGVTGYVMKYPLPGFGTLYIKVHFGNGPTILCRSFHCSDYSR